MPLPPEFLTKIPFVAPDAATAVMELDCLDVAAILVLYDGAVLTSAAVELSASAAG